ncbi:MAG: hypothetical protein HOH92_10315 [Crocinitomicaceae bacterium]|nr:hypothetical protein [Crocinitomicaceae bacterium]
MTAVLPIVPFPPLHWWHLATNCHGGGFIYEDSGHFTRQTLRNRMVISGPQGKVNLSFPVRSGNQSDEHTILSSHFAPVHSFRTLQAAYGGAPFFEHFEDELRELWHRYLPETSQDLKPLNAFSQATIDWAAQQCQWILIPINDPAPAFESSNMDLRDKRKLTGDGWTFLRYTQLFESVNGFTPACSILDALMTLGPAEVREQIKFLVRQGPNSN